MQAFQRLLLAGTVLSGFAWLTVGAAWTSEYATDQKAAGSTREHSPVMLAQAPPPAPESDSEPNRACTSRRPVQVLPNHPDDHLP